MGAAVRAEATDGDFQEFLHECQSLATKLMFPVVADWGEIEYAFAPTDRCRCDGCKKRNLHLAKDWSAA